MKYLITLTASLLMIFSQLHGQDPEGAIKTKDGFLLFFNYEPAFTMHLIGNVDFSNYPTINMNGDLFEFLYADSEPFGIEEGEILKNYMNWELNYIIETHKKSVQHGNTFLNTNGVSVNLWHYVNPTLSENDAYNSKHFFADFHKGERVYRISFLLFTGSDKEAQEQLISVIDNMRFYDHKIDVYKLSESITSGEYYKD